MQVMATNSQVNYIVQMVKNMDLDLLRQLPIPPELIRFKKGDITEKELKELLKNYSIRKAHNIIVVINRTV